MEQNLGDYNVITIRNISSLFRLPSKHVLPKKLEVPTSDDFIFVLDKYGYINENNRDQILFSGNVSDTGCYYYFFIMQANLLCFRIPLNLDDLDIFALDIHSKCFQAIRGTVSRLDRTIYSHIDSWAGRQFVDMPRVNTASYREFLHEQFFEWLNRVPKFPAESRLLAKYQASKNTKSELGKQRGLSEFKRITDCLWHKILRKPTIDNQKASFVEQKPESIVKFIQFDFILGQTACRDGHRLRQLWNPDGSAAPGLRRDNFFFINNTELICYSVLSHKILELKPDDILIFAMQTTCHHQVLRSNIDCLLPEMLLVCYPDHRLYATVPDFIDWHGRNFPSEKDLV